MPFAEAELLALDSAGFQVTNALTLADGPTGTHSHLCKFACMDGNAYWTKGEPVQQGLAGELIAARLAAMLGAGPPGAIVNVSEETLPASGNPGCSTGLLIGSLDQNDMFAARDIRQAVTRAVKAKQKAPRNPVFRFEGLPVSGGDGGESNSSKGRFQGCLGVSRRFKFGPRRASAWLPVDPSGGQDRRSDRKLQPDRVKAPGDVAARPAERLRARGSGSRRQDKCLLRAHLGDGPTLRR